MVDTIDTRLQHSLGPALVVQTTNGKVLLETPAGQAWARLALAYPYSPHKGDYVLAIGGDELYVIGVLAAKSETRLEFTGDVRLRTCGTLRLEAGQGISFAAPVLRIQVGRLEILAHKVVESVFDCVRRVKNTLRVAAGRQRVDITEDSSLRAGRISEIARDDVRLDGKRIKLG
jgi:hypothetical protein